MPHRTPKPEWTPAEIGAAALGPLNPQDRKELETFMAAHGTGLNTANPLGWALIHMAAHDGAPEVIEIILRTNPQNLDMTDNQGRTPLLIAVEMGHSDVAKRLLIAGASTHHKDRSGRTALDLAEKQGLKDIVALLKKT